MKCHAVCWQKNVCRQRHLLSPVRKMRCRRWSINFTVAFNCVRRRSVTSSEVATQYQVSIQPRIRASLSLPFFQQLLSIARCHCQAEKQLTGTLIGGQISIVDDLWVTLTIISTLLVFVFEIIAALPN